LDVAARGAIFDPTDEIRSGMNAMAESSKAARIASMRAQLAAPVQPEPTGFSGFQKRALKHWWTRFHGQAPGDDVTVEEMARQFLDPPAQWAGDSPRGFLAVEGSVPVVNKDGALDYLDPTKVHRIGIDVSDADARRLADQKAGALLSCLTLRVLCFSWPNIPLSPIAPAVRGQLVCWRGTGNDRLVEQAFLLGMVEILQDGFYAGPLASLPACPTPRVSDPPKRAYLDGYTPASAPEAQKFLKPKNPRSYEATPRTIKAMLPEPPERAAPRGPHESRHVRIQANVTVLNWGGGMLVDGETYTLNVWQALIGSVRANRHGTPYLVILDPLQPWEERFRRVVVQHAATHPGWTSADPDFPDFWSFEYEEAPMEQVA